MENNNMADQPTELTQQKNQTQQPKSNKNLTIVLMILIICLMAVIGVGVYKIFGEGNKTCINNKSDTATQTTSGALDIQSEIVKDLYGKVVFDLDQHVSDNYKQNTITNSYILQAGANQLVAAKAYTINSDGLKSFSSDQLATYVKGIFGDSIVYNDGNPDTGSYGYDASSKTYTYEAPFGAPYDRIYNKLVSATKSAKTITLTEKSIYANRHSDNSGITDIYSGYDKATLLETVDREGMMPDAIGIEPYSFILGGFLEKYYDRANTYKFTFTIRGDNYYLTNFEKI